jgi:ABC-type nitrate/sulfonate/bicarbonate transport system substrate-binding protein
MTFRVGAAMRVVAVGALIAGGIGHARAADHLKLAVGQCGNWDSSQVELGTRAGFYAKHGVEVEALCTQGTGETQQAVISGSADIGIGVGTLGALGAFAKGAPVRIISGSATGNADYWFVKADSPLKTIAARPPPTPSPTPPTARRATRPCSASSRNSASRRGRSRPAARRPP